MNTSDTCCPVCESPDTDRILDWDGSYDIRRCRDCRLVFGHPLPTENQLRDFYQGIQHNKPDRKSIAKTLQTKKKELSQFFRLNSRESREGKRFLDFGGGVGLTTKAAAGLGLDAYQVEIDEQSNAFATHELNLDSSHVFRTISQAEGREYSYIFSDNVIEHTNDPGKIIRELFDLLEPGGLLVIRTPYGGNTESLFYPLVTIRLYLSRALQYNGLRDSLRAYFKRWWHCDPPRHIFSFSPDSLHRLMSASGIDRYVLRYYNRALFESSLCKILLCLPSRPLGIFKRLLSLPALVMELGLKPAHALLRYLRLLSPSGITIEITKEMLPAKALKFRGPPAHYSEVQERYLTPSRDHAAAVNAGCWLHHH